MKLKSGVRLTRSSGGFDNLGSVNGLQSLDQLPAALDVLGLPVTPR